MKQKTCDRCCCVDSIDNPILELLDESDNVEEWVCMMCYAEEIDDADG